MLVFLAFKFSLWFGSFLAMFGNLRMTILLLWWLFKGLLSRCMGRLKLCVLLVLFQSGGVLPR